MTPSGRSLVELASLRGRVALVTGGAGHLGNVICDALAEAGAQVVIVDLDGQSAAAIAARIEDQHRVVALPLAVDLADESQLRRVPPRVVEQFGRLDILVNCAALVGTSRLGGWTTPFEEQSADTWRRALEINLTVPFILTQECAPALKASGRGSVINIGSIYGIVGADLRLYDGTTMGSPAAYAASKGGLLQLTRWLSTVLAPSIRVNAVSIGGIKRGQPEPFIERYESRVPLARMATEEDIKGAIVYFASDLSAYTTGQNLTIDGGFTAW